MLATPIPSLEGVGLHKAPIVMGRKEDAVYKNVSCKLKIEGEVKNRVLGIRSRDIDRPSDKRCLS